MSDNDINKIQQNVKELQDQNAIDFQQWKRLGKVIEKLSEKIKLSDTNLVTLMKKIKSDYESLKRIIIDENIQVQLNNKIEFNKNEILDNKNKIDYAKNKAEENSNKIEENKNEINKKVNNETFQSTIDEFNSELDNITTFITPEMVEGANDTERLQNAINYAISNNVLLVSKKNKTYIINATLNINGVLNANFNGSTIKATTENPAIDIYHKGSNSYNGKIENIIIDCNNISNIGLKLSFSQRREFKSIKIININSVGIQCDEGNVNKFNYIWLQGNKTKINTIGFKNNVYDNVVSHMDIFNCHISIEHNSGNCFYSEVHGLITNPKVMWKDSIFFKMNSYHHVILDKCYPDTQQIYYYMGDKGKLSITNNYGFNSYEILSDEIFSKGDKGYIFYCKDANASLLDRVSMNGSLMNGFKATDGSYKYEITNIPNNHTLLKLNTTDHFYSFNKLQSCMNNELINTTTSLTINKNIIKLAQETFSLQVEFEYNPSEKGVLPSTIGIGIGTLPNSYMYFKDGDYSFPVEYGIMTENNFQCMGYIRGYINSGEQKIRIMSTKDMYDSRTILCDSKNDTNYILKINITCPMYQY
jgi:hypothetical protein